MNEQEQRIKIAEAVGWTHFEPDTIQYTARRSDGKWDLIPDYLNDLNAMHDAVMMMDRDTLAYSNYCSHLNQIVAIDNSRSKARPIQACDATAAQRAEAFLKALNLWTE